MRRLARTMRFHLDEHLPHAIAEGLRRRGIDVTTTVEACLRGASDDVHLAYALEQQRVIVQMTQIFLCWRNRTCPTWVLPIAIREDGPWVRSFAG